MGTVKVRLRCSSAAVVALLTGVSACDVASGGSTGDELGLKAVPQASASAVAGGGGLDGVALGGRDADGFDVTVPATGDVVGPRDVRIAQSACGQAGYALSGTVVGKPASTVVRQAFGEGAKVTIVIAEYEGEQAQASMDALSTAVSECAGGFAVTVNGEERKVVKVVPEIAPQGADQAMALGAVVERDGVESPVKVVVFRKGAMVGYIRAVPEGRSGKGFVVPSAVVDAQLVKLG